MLSTVHRVDARMGAMPAGQRLRALRFRGCAPSQRNEARALYVRIKAGRPWHLPNQAGAR